MSSKYTKEKLYEQIGKNVIAYQHLEQLLKLIISRENIPSIKKAKENQEKLKKLSMGQLTDLHLKNKEGKEDLTEPVNVSHFIKREDEYYKRQEKVLKKIVEERNYLIHHSMEDFDLKDTSTFKPFIKKQEEQYNYLHNQIKYYITQYNIIIDTFQKFKIFKESKTFNTFIFQTLPIPQILISISKDNNDKWIELSNVGRLIRKKLPEEIKNIKTKYNCKNLKKLVLKSDMFDTKENKSEFFYKYKKEIILKF